MRQELLDHFNALLNDLMLQRGLDIGHVTEEGGGSCDVARFKSLKCVKVVAVPESLRTAGGPVARQQNRPGSQAGGVAGYEPPMPTNASTPFAQTSPQPARDIQEDAADLAAVIPWLTGPPLQPRRGLTDQDLERITRATGPPVRPALTRSTSTRGSQWATWCAERGFEPLPADPAAMCAFMTQRVADGLAVISLSPFISVTNYVHSAHGLPNPNDNRAVRQVRDGLRRTYGVAPVRQAHPLSVAGIRIGQGLRPTPPTALCGSAAEAPDIRTPTMVYLSIGLDLDTDRSIARIYP